MRLMIECDVKRHEKSLANNNGKRVKQELAAVIKPVEQS
jgi:hypothetical protein